MRNWLCITNHYNWDIVNQNNIWAVDQRYQITLEQHCTIGDQLVFYVTKNINNGLRHFLQQLNLPLVERQRINLPRGCFTGLYRISSDYYISEENLGFFHRDGTLYTHRRSIELIVEPTEPVPLIVNDELFNELPFIADKTISYYCILYPSMVLITEDDVAIFRNFFE